MYKCKSPLDEPAEDRTRGHKYKLPKRYQYGRTKSRLAYFSYRVVDTWNALDKETVDADTVNIFKNRTDLAFHDIAYCSRVKHPINMRAPLSKF